MQERMVDLVLPSMTNGHGTLFGGKALEMMDKAAAVVCLRHSRCDVVTAAMDEVSFTAPIHESDIIEVVATIIETGRTSMVVEVVVSGENPKTGEKTECTKAQMTMVAIDETGKPTEVPSLHLEEFIGVVERNPSEGEIFGYYWENTEENRQNLQKARELMPDELVGEDYGQFHFEGTTTNKKELEFLEEHDENHYMARVNIVGETDWDVVLDALEDGEMPFYKGTGIL